MVESKHQWKAWLYLLPAIILLLVFTVWPIINTVSMAFQEGYDESINQSMRELSRRTGQTFRVSYPIGIDNFRQVIAYKGFSTALANTMLLCVATVPISTMLALLIAVALNSIKPLKKFLQTIFFLPYVTNSIAIADSLGIVNNVFKLFGKDPISWINQGSSYWANMTVLIVYIVWNALPFKILVLLGGLQSINKQYYEAARVDGTPRRRVFTRITVPLLSPMIVYVVITGFIGGFKEYSSIVGIFGDTMGPSDNAGAMNTMVGYIYNALEGGEAAQGRASAAALLLFGIILVVTLINLRISKKRVHY